METASSSKTTFVNYLDLALSNDIKPTGEQIINRGMFGLPIFLAGGILAAHTLTNNNICFIPNEVGALFGAAFIAANMLTSMACKVLGISIKEKSTDLAIKYIVDIAIAALLTFTACYLEKIPLAASSLAVLPLGVFSASSIIFMAIKSLKIRDINDGLNKVLGDLTKF